METPFTEQDSLRLINEMIAQTKRNYQRGAGSPMILWGSLTTVLALLFVGLHNLYPGAHWVNYIWCLMPLGVIPQYFITRRANREPRVRTQIDRIVVGIWLGMIISFTFLFGTFMWGFSKKMLDLSFFLPSCFLLFGGYFFATGWTCRWKPFYLSALVFWTGGILEFGAVYIARLSCLSQLVLLAAVMFGGLVIPGILINREAVQNTGKDV